MNDNEKVILIKTMLEAIGEKPNREGLKDTPKRVVKMWKEIFRGYDKSQLPKVITFNNGKDGIVYDEMITDTGTLTSWCEHHMLPFTGTYWCAIIPHSNGKLLGLSKIGRVVDYFSSKLQIQERLVHEIVEYLWDELYKDCTYPPLGVALVMEAEHSCKSIRGLKKKGKMRTTKLLGVFKTDSDTRQEFMGWVNSNGKT